MIFGGIIHFILIFSLAAQSSEWDLLFSIKSIASSSAAFPQGISEQNGDGYDDITIVKKINDEWHTLLYFGGSPMDTTPDFDFGAWWGEVTLIPDLNGDSKVEYMIGNKFFYGGLPLQSEPDLIFPKYFLNNEEDLLSYNNIGDISGDGWDDLACFNFSNGIEDTNSFTIYYGGTDIDTIPDLLLWEDVANDGFKMQTNSQYKFDLDLNNIYDQKIAIFTENNQLFNHNVWLGPIEEISPDTVLLPMLNSDSSYYYFGFYKGDYNKDGITDMTTKSLKPDTNYFASYMVVDGADDFEQETVIGQLNIPSTYGTFIPCGDVNGDGYTDIISGSRYAFGVGAIYLYLGGPEMGQGYWGCDVYWYGGYSYPYPELGVGARYSWIGDINGDGLDDIGFSSYDPLENPFGDVYIYAGKSSWVNPSVSTKDEPTLPENFSLDNPFPNPFNSTITIPFSLYKNIKIAISVFDLKGRFVETILTGYQSAGKHEHKWNANHLISGVYFIRLSSGNISKTRKIIYLK